jgi:branched-chain amino acid transport system substrate-binding protein
MSEHSFQISRRKLLKSASVAAFAIGAPAIVRAQSAPIKIGHQQDVTGFLSPYGTSLDRGARTTVEYINANGGIAGRQLEYVLEDSESDVQVGIRKFRKLAESDNVDFVLGATHSGTNLATNPIAKETKTLHFPQGEASDTTGVKGNRYVFRVRAHSGQQGRGSVAWAIKNLGKKWTFAITDYSYGHSFYDELAPVVKAAGGTVLERIAVPTQTQDMLPFLSRIPRDTEVLFGVFTSGDGLRYLRQTYELGISKKVARFGPWGIVDGVNISGLEEPLEGAYFLSHSPRRLDQVPAAEREFVAAARKIIKVNDDGTLVEAPDRTIASSYYLAPWHTLHAIKAGIEKSGWKSKQDNAALIVALEGFKGSSSQQFPMGGFTLRSEDHQSFQTLWIEQVQKGQLRVVGDISPESQLFEPRIDVTKEQV